jgi:hypothetical protein
MNCIITAIVRPSFGSYLCPVNIPNTCGLEEDIKQLKLWFFANMTIWHMPYLYTLIQKRRILSQYNYHPFEEQRKCQRCPHQTGMQY